MKLEDKKAIFEGVYEEFGDSVFRYLLVRTTDRDIALELTQEVFARVWKSMLEGKNMPNTRAYVFTVARNLVIDWYRKRKTVSLDAMMEDEENPFEPADAESEGKIEINADALSALRSLKKIRPEYEEVVYLRFVEELSPQEIARIVDSNANTVSIRITRGLEELRKIMKI